MKPHCDTDIDSNKNPIKLLPPIPDPVLHTGPLKVNRVLSFQTARPSGCRAALPALKTMCLGAPRSLSSHPRGAAPLTCSHKEDSCTEHNIVLAAVDPPGTDAQPSKQEQDGAEDGKDTGGPHDA